MNVRGARVGVKAGPLYLSAPIVPGRSPYGQRAAYQRPTQQRAPQYSQRPATVYRAQPKRGAGHYMLAIVIVLVLGFLGMAALALAAPVTIPTAAAVIIARMVIMHKRRAATHDSDTGMGGGRHW